jgi:hypothetical protein
LGYIIHEIIHFLIGSGLAYLICSKETTSKLNRGLVMFFGGAAASSPDITKFFGDLLGHSIWFGLLFGLVFAFIFRFFIKEISFKKSWFTFSLCVILGHIFIDYLGNGVALFYPFIEEDFDFSIIKRVDNLILYTLLLTVITGFFFRKGKIIILSGLLIVSLYFGILSFSKIQLQQALKDKYKDEHITLLLIYPRLDNQWEFQVRTKKVSVIGYSPTFNTKINIERERKITD